MLSKLYFVFVLCRFAGAGVAKSRNPIYRAFRVRVDDRESKNATETPARQRAVLYRANNSAFRHR